LLHCDNEGGGSGRALGLGGEGQILGVVGDQHADEKNTEDVEDDDSPEGKLDGLGDGLAGVLGLSDGNTNQLGTWKTFELDKPKARGDQFGMFLEYSYQGTQMWLGP
jgi:hypothetical protein